MATSKKAPTKAAAADPGPAPAAVAAKLAKPKAPAKTTATAKPAPKAAVAPAVPVAKKVAVKTVAAKSAPTAPAAPKVAAKPKAQPKKKAGVEGHTIDAQQRANYIEVAAFYIAERRGFAPGNPEQDYLDAAAEIDRMVVAGHFAK